jgi:hypothetical protein
MHTIIFDTIKEFTNKNPILLSGIISISAIFIGLVLTAVYFLNRYLNDLDRLMLNSIKKFEKNFNQYNQDNKKDIMNSLLKSVQDKFSSWDGYLSDLSRSMNDYSIKSQLSEERIMIKGLGRKCGNAVGYRTKQENQFQALYEICNIIKEYEFISNEASKTYKVAIRREFEKNTKLLDSEPSEKLASSQNKFKYRKI